MDFLNPFTYLGSAAGKGVADGWTAAMLGLWNAGLWLLKLVLTLVDAFTVPDLSEGGPGAQVYQMTFWIALALMLLLTMVQLAVTAARRDGPILQQEACDGPGVVEWFERILNADRPRLVCRINPESRDIAAEVQQHSFH